MTYRNWMAWSPALGWESNTDRITVKLCKKFFEEVPRTEGCVPAPILYGPMLMRGMSE